MIIWHIASPRIEEMVKGLGASRFIFGLELILGGNLQRLLGIK